MSNAQIAQLVQAAVAQALQASTPAPAGAQKQAPAKTSPFAKPTAKGAKPARKDDREGVHQIAQDAHGQPITLGYNPQFKSGGFGVNVPGSNSMRYMSARNWKLMCTLAPLVSAAIDEWAKQDESLAAMLASDASREA